MRFTGGAKLIDMEGENERIGAQAVRFVTAWNTTEPQVDELLKLLADYCVSV